MARLPDLHGVLHRHRRRLFQGQRTARWCPSSAIPPFSTPASPGLVNAVFNHHDFTLVILDNGTTAMTGHQPQPGRWT
ncbi:MAG: thiamine pyrophosphate-dependent enzyme [Desulfobacterales bacterium]|nr:thiamine pyrophosphate-dependent enzyme [Desulfobacterales bacterium]